MSAAYLRPAADLPISSTENEPFENFFTCSTACVNLLQVELEERVRIHLVAFVDIGIEPIPDAVRQDSNLRVGNAEIPEQLPGMLPEVVLPVLALDEYLRLSVNLDGNVDFLALFSPVVAGHFRDDFERVVQVVAERADERVDEGVLRSLLGQDGVLQRECGRQDVSANR